MLRLLPLPLPLPRPLPLPPTEPLEDLEDGILGPFLSTGVLGVGSGEDGGLAGGDFGDFGDLGVLGGFFSGSFVSFSFLSGEHFLSGDIFLSGETCRLQELIEPSSSEPV